LPQNVSKERLVIEGILLVNKPRGKTSFSLVSALRKMVGIRKIGHAGTLDPFATGVMVMLIGKNYTRLSDQLLTQDKEYLAQAHLGIATDTYDCEGKPTATSGAIPTREQIEEALQQFQGEIDQQPPMYSAKKIQGKKLYELARKGKTIDRPSAKVWVHTELVDYDYPLLTLKITCSKGTYIRSLAHDLGSLLGCGAHLSALKRLRSGLYRLEECLDGEQLIPENLHLLSQALIRHAAI
jgi:tRNA pseudouridine55 synthase